MTEVFITTAEHDVLHRDQDSTPRRRGSAGGKTQGRAGRVEVADFSSGTHTVGYSIDRNRGEVGVGRAQVIHHAQRRSRTGRCRVHVVIQPGNHRVDRVIDGDVTSA